MGEMVMKKYWLGFMLGMVCSTSICAQPQQGGTGTVTLYKGQEGSFNLSELRTSEDFSIKILPQGQSETFIFHVNCSRGTLSFVYTDSVGDLNDEGSFIKTESGMINKLTKQPITTQMTSMERFVPGYWEAFCPHVPLVKN